MRPLCYYLLVRECARARATLWAREREREREKDRDKPLLTFDPPQLPATRRRNAAMYMSTTVDRSIETTNVAGL